MFPYVGKNIANLTLAQVKTLDCGSQRLSAFRKYHLCFCHFLISLMHTAENQLFRSCTPARAYLR